VISASSRGSSTLAGPPSLEVLGSDKLFFEKAAPTFLEYRELRDSVGWRLAYYEMDGQFLGRASFCVAVRSRADRRLQAFGSVILSVAGFELYDLLVRPENQGTGLGSAITQQLLACCQDYVNCHTPACADFQVHAIHGTEGFYTRFGLRLLPIQAPGYNEMRLKLQKRSTNEACADRTLVTPKASN
jgi:GNAT superfamily N-acetyltransferase